MHIEKGQVLELILQNGFRQARLTCAGKLVPAPGQYLLIGDSDSGSSLPVPIFFTDSASGGFVAAAPVPDSWTPGRELYLRGPFGRGFLLPASARKVGLVACGDSPARLYGLIQRALNQDAAVVLVSDLRMDHLPDEVEMQPLSALSEIIQWADYIAFDAARGSLAELKEGLLNRRQTSFDAQILVYTPVPCGGVAECGVCAVTVKSAWKMACKDGPVFDWKELLLT